MPISRSTLKVSTQGNSDIIDITGIVEDSVRKSTIKDGIAVIFCQSSTSALTTIEFESGCIEDFKQFFEKILPSGVDYRHNLRWGDGNGSSHLRAALLGPSITIPVANQHLILGTWQQVVMIDFDNRPRQRELIVQLIGE